MSRSQSRADQAIVSLEAATEATRGGFGCLFSSSDEYEQALISARRAEGRYQTPAASPATLWLFVACVALLFATGLTLL